MNKTLITLLTLIAVLAITTGAFAEQDTDAKLKAMEKRLQKLEIKSAKDRIQWTGDLRVEAHSITGEVDPYIDGMRMQALTFGHSLGDVRGLLVDVGHNGAVLIIEAH